MMACRRQAHNGSANIRDTSKNCTLTPRALDLLTTDQTSAERPVTRFTILRRCLLAVLLILSMSFPASFPAPAYAQGAVSALRKLLDSGRVPPERQGAILEMICTRGEPDDLA